MVARWGEPRSPTGGHREQDAGDHQGLVKIPRIFLALPRSTTLAPTDVDRAFCEIDVYWATLPVVSGFFLGTENGIDGCATDGALTLQGGFTVFHGYPLGVFHLALGFALDAIIQISHGEVASLRPF